MPSACRGIIETKFLIKNKLRDESLTLENGNGHKTSCKKEVFNTYDIGLLTQPKYQRLSRLTHLTLIQTILENESSTLERGIRTQITALKSSFFAS